jgi:DNA repair protein RecO (recombination protein O)
MRHKYETRGIVLSRSPLGEANALIILLTQELGLVRARVQGVRQPGAKLAIALTTLSESEVILVRGKESWRVAGAILAENWFDRLRHAEPRMRAGRICNLLLRLVADGANDQKLFSIIRDFFEALTELPGESQEQAEILAVLRILSALGLDAGEIPSSGKAKFSKALLDKILKYRSRYIERINHDLDASGL